MPYEGGESFPIAGYQIIAEDVLEERMLPAKANDPKLSDRWSVARPVHGGWKGGGGSTGRDSHARWLPRMVRRFVIAV